jgi:hypothetical protein
MKTNPSDTSFVRRLLESVVGVFAAAWMLGTSHAGTNTYYFNSPNSTNGLTIFSQGGGGYLRPSGGSPNDPQVTGPSTNGCFVLTDAVNDQRGIILFPDFDSGLVVKAFKFSGDMRIGAGSGSPADGFSICFARADDPLLINNNGSGWAASLCGEADLPEEGTQTGLAVCFDAWNSDCGDVIGLTIRVDNAIVTNISLPYANLAPSNPNFASSLQTGPNNAGLAGLTWQPLSVEYTTNGLLSVAYKGVTLLTNCITPFSPTVGRLILGGRTGGYYQNQHIDNIRIDTIPATTPVVGPALGNGYGFTVSIFGGGAATPDTNTLTVQLDGVTIVSHGTNASSETATVSNSGVIATIAYSQSAPFVGGTTHAVRVIVSGAGFSGMVDETRLFVAPTLRYVDVNSASPMPPYTNWVTAATNIQDAVDAAAAGDEVVVTNGTYASGGRAVDGTLTNRVAVDKPLTLRSVNGPGVTVIQGRQVPGTTNGDGAIRCVYLTSGASLCGFTLTNGATRMAGDYDREQTGGGVWCLSTSAVLSNCVLSGNSAYNNSGGASLGTLINCTLVRNSALASGSYGGGVSGGTLNNCTLSGNTAQSGGGASGGTLNTCTLTGNSARSSGGGAYYSTLNNCTLSGNFARASGGGSYYGTLNTCTLTGNSATNSGGGAYYSTLNNCTLSGNFARSTGGGAYYGMLNNCTLTGNSATNPGGGTYYGTLNHCTLSGNFTRLLGGGAYSGRLTNCTLTGNSATNSGGGAFNSTLYNCTLTGNSASSGGGASGGTLNNCTVTGNSASASAGGVSGGVLNNCIVYYNTAPSGSNWSGGTFRYCCTTPLPGGLDNTSADPQLASAYHISAGSPCRGAGSTNYAVGVDIDGEAWATPPSIGCDEYWAGNLTGPLSVSISATYTNVPPGFAVDFTALISGKTTATLWNFGDWTLMVNRPYVSHAWWATGDYTVVLIAYNEDYPEGVIATVTVHVVPQLTHYVAQGSTHPVAPYTTWATAATNIQDAIDAVYAAPKAMVLVSNGVYAAGGRAVYGTMTNRVAVYKPITVLSVNGPDFTQIQGHQVPGTTNGNGAIRCVYLTNGAVLSGFTLKSGATRGVGGIQTQEQNGGGVWCQSVSAVVTNCMVTGNSAYWSGGGAYGGTLNNCTLTGNSAYDSGGGAYSGKLNNCAVTGNSATYGGGAYSGMLTNSTLTGNSASSYGGGAYSGTLNNCIVYFNSASFGANYYDSTLTYCCTTPLPASGAGNLSLDPQLASASHLSMFSPCRGAGNAAYTSGVDIDGEAWNNPPSIGCDEYHSGAATGPLSVAIWAAYTNVAVGYPVEFAGAIQGRTSLSVWEFGDGEAELNQPYTTHSWTAPGEYIVALWALNDSHPEGVSATVTIHVVGSPVYYVAAGSTNPVAPYDSWVTAAANIQDAVDAAAVGGTVLVTNGIYQTGGWAVYGTMTNRVAVDRPLRVQSVNGPGSTMIQGYQVPGTTNGDGAIRCAYLNDGVVLSGFTLTQGATRTTGDTDREQSGGGVWCASAGVLVTNCVLAGNSSYGSGGAYSGTLDNCTLIGNSAQYGGGAYSATLNNCTVTGNSAYYSGGGAYFSTLNNCTLTGNSASSYGGGVYSGTLNNCIVYYNTAPTDSNYSGGTLNYCCTTPLPSGAGNTDAEPQLASASHISAASPCRGAGNWAYATGVDIDGEAWANPPSIGCDEYRAGNVTGSLSVGIGVTYTTVLPGFAVEFTALVSGRVSASMWDLGEGIAVSNQPYASRAWATIGDYPVILTAYNEDYPAGVSATVTVHVVEQVVHYVSQGNANSVAPYTSWATAATNIQDAVDAVYSAPQAMVLVSNGVYAAGGKLVFDTSTTNRVAVDKPITVRSVNGPGFTAIRGWQVPGTTNDYGAIRCVYLTEGAVLAGFTLTNGATDYDYGGGVYCQTVSAVVSNCVLSGNSAGYGGGGAFNGTLNNCTLTGNSAYSDGGGGAYYVALNNCTLTGNSAYYGGGAYYCALNNCIVYANTATEDANYDAYYSTLNYCCTAPQPASGLGNITNAPLFVDLAGNNLRLQSGSPCINAALNAYAPGLTDLDGNPRLVGGTVDMGAYECQSPALLDYYSWLQSYGLPTDSSSLYPDSDGDGMNNWQEWQCRTVPTNALSALRMLTATLVGTNVTVTWQSVAGVRYFLERGTNLGGHPGFWLLAPNVLGQADTTTYTDTNAASLSPLFYRVGVGANVAPTNPPQPMLTWQQDTGTGTLQLSWNGLGYRLQAQTNGAGYGLRTNWFDYPGGTTSPVTVPVESRNGSVFYRLVWP